MNIIHSLILFRINKRTNQRNGNQRVNKNGSQKALTKIVHNILDSKAEKKYIATEVSSTLSNTGTLVDLTAISQGSSAITRVGASITVKSIEFNGVFLIADTTNTIRLKVFEWYPSDVSDVPQFNEIQNSSTSVYSQDLPIKPSRFRKLYDKMLILDTYHPMRPITFKLKLDHKVGYELGTDSGSRHIYMSLQSDSGAATHPAYSYNTCVKFLDD